MTGLGIEQPSFFFYDKFGHVQASGVLTPKTYYSKGEYRAYTVGELGLMLPEDFITGALNPKKDYWTCFEIILGSDYSIQPKSIANSKTEAEVRAAALIHLLTTGKLTPNQVNSHL